MGIGPVGASAVVATVGDFKQFKNGAQFGAWLGLVPKQRSSGGKSNLGTITKRGDPYVRTLLVQGAKSVVNSAHTRTDPISRWVLALKERSGWQKAVVALANKNARILWAVMTKGVAFDRHHVSVKPGSRAIPPSMTTPASSQALTASTNFLARRHQEDARIGQTGGGQTRLTLWGAPRCSPVNGMESCRAVRIWVRTRCTRIAFNKTV